MIVNGIDTRDISVVVQGAVGSYTPTCLASVREHLPGAEIVLSTWKGSNVEGLDYDTLLLNDDPGAFDCMNSDFDKPNNIDRQTLSTRTGLQAAERTYAVKLRTDFSLTSHDFLNWYGKYPKRSRESWLSEKVIACTIYSRDPRNKKFSLPAHPSDFFFFGLRPDLLELFDVGLTSEEDRIWFARKYPDEFQYEIHRFVPEQFLWTKFLTKHVDQANAIPDDIHDIRKETISMTERSIAGNLILLSPEQMGIVWEKDLFHMNSPDTCYSHSDWCSLYMRYCGGNVLPYGLYRIKSSLKNTRTRIYKVSGSVLGRLKEPVKKLGHRLMLWVKKHIRPHVSDQRWAEWKLRFLDWKLEFWRWRRREPERYTMRTAGPDLSDKDLSVVVQGAIGPGTKETLRSIRHILPQAEIVLSTWEGSDTDGLDYDLLVKSEDPGPDGLIRRYPHKQIHNVSRKIVSTRAGVDASTRFFCLKIRSDMQILSDGFIGYYNQFSRCMGPSAYFQRRVMVNGTTTRPDILEVGDWWYLGTKKDIGYLFDISLYHKEEISYFEREENAEKKPYGSTVVCQYPPETHIVYSFLRKVDRKLPFMENYTCEAYHYADAQKKFLIENLLCIEPAISGIVLPKARNVENPFSYRFWLPIIRWYLMVREAGMVKRVKFPKEAANVMEQRYLRQPHWYDVSNWISIVKNYAKIQRVPFREETWNIRKDDMTFVVCGKIEHYGEWNTYHGLNSIRRFFPASRIILATWEGENVEHLSGLYDELVLCERPKLPKRNIYTRVSGMKKYNSINDQRYLVSEGFKRVTTKYAVKTRTDFYLINDNILHFYKKWASILDKREEGYQVFDGRVLVSQYFVFEPRMLGGAKAYALSDCFQMGLTRDLKMLWNGERIPDEVMNWFDEHPDSEMENPEQFNHQYIAEQLFFLPLLKKVLPDLPYPRWYFDREQDAYTFESEKVLASNVLIGDRRLMGLATKFDSFGGSIPFNRLLELYLENVDPENQECLDYLEKLYEN